MKQLMEWLKKKTSKSKKTFTKGIAKVSGKNIEEVVLEFSEVYGEILLGIDREIKSMRKTNNDYRIKMDEMLTEAKVIRNELQNTVQDTHTIQLTKRISVIALVLAIIAILGVTWMIV